MLSLGFAVLTSAEFAPMYLDDYNFSSSLANVPLALVLANQKNVSFCQDFLPKYLDAGAKCEGKAVFAIIETDTSVQIRADYHIFAYPSVFVFRYGKKTIEYVGDKDSYYVVNFIDRISGPEVTNLESARDVHDYIEAQPNCVILAGEELDEDTLSVFSKVASTLRDKISFGIARDIDAIEQIGIEDPPALKLYRSQDRASIVYPLAFAISEDTLEKWITDNLIPKYYARDSTTFRDLVNQKPYTFLAFVDSSKKRSLDSLHKVMNAVTDEFHDNLTYVYCDVYDVGSIMLGLGFSGAVEPAYAIVKIRNGELAEKFVFSERRRATPAAITKWTGKFLEGHMAPKIRSEPLPEEDPEAPPSVRKLVGSTFSGAVVNQERDVVVLFLTGAQDDRTRINRVFRDVGSEFRRQRIPRVDFYTLDLDKNDTPGLNTEAIKESSVVIFPAGKQPVLIGAPRDPKTLAQYIVQSASTKPHFRSLFARFREEDEGSLEL